MTRTRVCMCDMYIQDSPNSDTDTDDDTLCKSRLAPPMSRTSLSRALRAWIPQLQFTAEDLLDYEHIAPHIPPRHPHSKISDDCEGAGTVLCLICGDSPAVLVADAKADIWYVLDVS